MSASYDFFSFEQEWNNKGRGEKNNVFTNMELGVVEDNS